MLGVEVTGVESRVDLPEIVRDDMVDEYDGDETTPVSVEDLDDIDKLRDDE